MLHKKIKKYTAVIIESRLRELSSKEVRDFLEKTNALDSEFEIKIIDKPEDYLRFAKDKEKIASINMVMLGKYEPVVRGSIEQIIFDFPVQVELGTISYYGWEKNNEKANTIKEILTEIQSFKRKYERREANLPAGMPELQLN